jgi:hypothetical protein
MKEGFKLFVIQISSLVLINILGILFYYFFSSDLVVSFNAINRIYISSLFLFYAGLQPFWYRLVKESNALMVLRAMTGYWLVYVLGLLIVAFNARSIFLIWMGSLEFYNVNLIWSFVLYCIGASLQGILSYYMNAQRIISPQFFISKLFLLSNVPIYLLLLFLDVSMHVVVYSSSVILLGANLYYLYHLKHVRFNN